MTCPACGAPVPAGARFCPSCGQLLVARADERRVVTVVFADVVGFTSMAEAMDPEQVKRLVDRTMEVLAADVLAFGGLVDKVVGDAMVALFGAPTAHEDDAERAVRAALRMQESIVALAPKLDVPVRLRIGVNTGEVLVGATRAGGDYTALGDVVNTAQRLQVAAEPGDVVVGPATYTATAEAIRYEPLGEVRAKGREASVHAWLAVAPTAPPGRRPRRVRGPLVGREHEVALIGDLVALGTKHGRAQLIVIEGEAGVGKSRLAEETAGLAEHCHGARVLEGHCLPYGEPNQWWPLAVALQGVLGVEPGMSDDDVRQAVRQGVDRALSATLGRAVNTLEAERVATGLAAVLGRPDPGVAGEGVDPARARDEVARSVTGYVEALARSAPVVLVMSDLHWADEVLLDLLGRLLVKLGGLPFTMVATIRGPLDEVWEPPSGRHHVLSLRLDPLDRAAAAELLEAVLGERVPAELADQLLHRSGGNPLFLEELAVVAGQTGDLQLLPALPDTLRGLIVARLDALSPEERAMLDNAAVLGSSGLFSHLKTFGTALGQPTERAVLRRLGEGDLLDVDGDRWVFRSQAVREVAYQTLTKEARAQRHAGVAASMEMDGARADRVAHHWATAAELAAELGGTVPKVPDDAGARALHWLGVAGESARDQDTHPPVVRFASRALGLIELGIGGPADRRRFLRLRAWGLSGQRLLTEARADALAALADAEQHGDDRDAAAALTLLGTVDQRAGHLDTASATLADAVERWRALGDDEGVASALRAAGLTALFSADPTGAEAFLQEARRLSVAAGDRRGEAWAAQHLAWLAFLIGDTELADRRLQGAATTFSDIGDVGGLGWALGLLAFVRYQQGRLEEAAAIAEEVRREASERGDNWGLGMMLVLLAGLQLWRGQPDAATSLAADARELFRRLGDRFAEAQALVPLARAHLAAGRSTEARRAVEACRAVSAGGGSAAVVADVLSLAMAVWSGDAERAGAAVATADEAARGAGAFEWWAARAIAALQAGDLELAQRAADEVATRAGHPYAEAVVALVDVARGDAVSAQRRAALVQEHQGATHLDRLLASLAAAFACLILGDRVAGRRELDAARAAVDETGDRLAQAVVRLADAEVLAVLGSPAAPLARREADLRIATLDVPGSGWVRLFRLLAAAIPDGRALEPTP